jgi:hypothetical protein
MAAIWPDRFSGMSPNLMRYWAEFFPATPTRAGEKDLPLCGTAAERNTIHQALMFNGTANDMGVENLARLQTRFRPYEAVWPNRAQNRPGTFRRDEKRKLTYFHSPDGRFQINAADECYEYVKGKKKTFGAHGLGAWQSRMVWDWLRKQVRRRPDEFFYIKAAKAGDGAWGVRVKDNPDIDPWDPMTWERFECRVDGDTVTITSHNTPGLTVDLGTSRDGRSLGLSGPVKVIFNGKPAYSGPATTINLE